MKPLPNDIVLRPRFQFEIPQTKETVLKSFEGLEKNPFIIKRLDEHIYIKFNPEQNNFWSPQLHLEIDEIDENNCKLFGVFGPNPALWTFFMFLHFGVATLFIIIGIWAYSSASLEKAYGLQLGLMGLMLVLWITLYLFGRLGKRSGKPQMKQLYVFMTKILWQVVDS